MTATTSPARSSRLTSSRRAHLSVVDRQPVDDGRRRRPCASPGRGSTGWPSPPSRCRSGVGDPPRVADGERNGIPSGEPGELDDRRGHRGGAEHLLGRAGHRRRSPSRDEHRPVGEGDHPLEPVLGEDDRHAEVVRPERVSAASTSSAAAGSSAEVGSSRTSTRGEAVSTAPIADPLLLSSREGRERAVAELVQAEQVEGVLDAPSHRARRDRPGSPSCRRARPRRRRSRSSPTGSGPRRPRRRRARAAGGCGSSARPRGPRRRAGRR